MGRKKMREWMIHRQTIGLFAGIAIFALILVLPTPQGAFLSPCGQRQVTIPEMARCGLWMSFISIAIVTLVLYLLAIPIFGITDGVPDWAR
jgi:di/tricarboxylate transporter